MRIFCAKSGIAVFLSLLLWLSGCGARNRTVCIKNACVSVDIAQDQKSRSMGLMFRKPLAYNEGMFFIFERPDRYAFWMKNVYFPIDIIWISPNKTVVDIKSHIPVCHGFCESYLPAKEALYVLEVSAGFAQKEGIQVGDTVFF